MDKFCQSCGMPLSGEELLGTEKNGEKNQDFCVYCYENGAFTNPEMTMAQMIEVCVPHMKESGYTEEKAREMMEQFLPTLKRWKTA